MTRLLISHTAYLGDTAMITHRENKNKMSRLVSSEVHVLLTSSIRAAPPGRCAGMDRGAVTLCMGPSEDSRATESKSYNCAGQGPKALLPILSVRYPCVYPSTWMLGTSVSLPGASSQEEDRDRELLQKARVFHLFASCCFRSARQQQVLCPKRYIPDAS